MKLLIDQNLSYRLVQQLQALYPGTEHVLRLGLINTADTVIWEFARQKGFCILTQDEDFLDLSVVRGAPPKVVLLRSGNLPTADIAELLKSRYLLIYTLLGPESEVNCLKVG